MITIFLFSNFGNRINFLVESFAEGGKSGFINFIDLDTLIEESLAKFSTLYDSSMLL